MPLIIDADTGQKSTSGAYKQEFKRCIKINKHLMNRKLILF